MHLYRSIRKGGLMNYAAYLKRIIDNPNTSREEYMWAWRELQNIQFKQHVANAAAEKYNQTTYTAV